MFRKRFMLSRYLLGRQQHHRGGHLVWPEPELQRARRRLPRGYGRRPGVDQHVPEMN